MWAVVKRAINSTLGTKDDMPLDVLQRKESQQAYYDIAQLIASGGQGVFIVPKNTVSLTNAIPQDTTILVLPYGLKTIGDKIAEGLPSLSTVKIPDTVRNIGNRAFAGSYITSLSLPKRKDRSSVGLTIGANAFENTGLNYVEVTDTVYLIAERAFTDNFYIESVDIVGDDDLDIGSKAFGNCKNLKKVTFWRKNAAIASTAFEGCDNLTDIYVPWSEGYTGGAPWGATNATIHYKE